jgi:hypothetical protein
MFADNEIDLAPTSLVALPVELENAENEYETARTEDGKIAKAPIAANPIKPISLLIYAPKGLFPRDCSQGIVPKGLSRTVDLLVASVNGFLR